ncbi:MMPL family transporter [Chungangia koreensis]|uniref:MMPL family transporter n=1 Tax=Chungangia koreensis TaxID=752657 RepID=A0ABV8X1Y1_9LACT
MKIQPFNKWGSMVAGKRSRWITIILCMALVVLLGGLFPQINSIENFGGDDLPEEVMSRQADQIMEGEFPSDSGIPLLIVWYKESGLTIDDIAVIQKLYAELEDKPLNGQVALPPFASLPPQMLMENSSVNGHSIVTPVFFDEATNTEVLKEELEKISEMTKQLIGEDPFTLNTDEGNLIARFSGPVGIAVDATDLFKSADFKLMAATVFIILVILLLIYRSPILAILPIIVVSIAFLVISPLLGAMAEFGWIDKDAQAVSIMIVLLFGAGTDYCLFLITRYRDLLDVVENKYDAINRAISESAGAIIISALTVVVGLATLSLAEFGAFQRFAIPFSFGVLITSAAVLTLLPAILAVIGRGAFWPFIPRPLSVGNEYTIGKNGKLKKPKENHRYMKKVGAIVTRHPWIIISITSVILIGLAITSTTIKYNYDLLSSFPEEMPSREGFALIEENFTAGQLAPVHVLVNSHGNDTDLKPMLENLPYVSKVDDRRMGENNAEIHLYEVELSKNPYSNEAMDDLEVMKEDLKDILSAADMPQHNYWLGGETSAQLDTKEIQLGDEKRIQPVMILIIFAVLLIYLRAILTSIQLMATVIVSFFAALGLGWLILSGLLGHDSIGSSIPLYSFVFIVALGNDYNIFMISDIWKNRKKGLSHKEAIIGGIASTGAVITSAGLILAGTFAVLTTLPIQLLVQFGVITAVGILLDTFIVRPLLVPSLLTVMGRFSYWPGKQWKK